MSETPAYTVLIEPTARRALDRLPREIQSRLIRRIEMLGRDPRPPGSIKLKGEEAYRIRVGYYRVIFGIADERLLVLIVAIGHRREIYRKG